MFGKDYICLTPYLQEYEPWFNNYVEPERGETLADISIELWRLSASLGVQHKVVEESGEVAWPSELINIAINKLY